MYMYNNVWIYICKCCTHTDIKYTGTHLIFSHQVFFTILHMAKEEVSCGEIQSSLLSSCFQYPPFVIPWSWSSTFLLDLCFHDGRIRRGNPSAVNHMTSSYCQVTEAQIDHRLVRVIAVMVSSAPCRMWYLRYWGSYCQSGRSESHPRIIIFLRVEYCA